MAKTLICSHWWPLSLFFSLLLKHLSASYQRAAAPNYSRLVFNSTEFPPSNNYDYSPEYIIVGRGTAGYLLAATISQNHKVLLLERGGVPCDNPNLMTREGFFTGLLDVDVDSPAQAFSSEGILNTCGIVLVGSSRADQDFIRQSRVSWDLRAVNQSAARDLAPQPKTWQFPPLGYYDYSPEYIIVGGGKVGCSLATALSQNNKVLLLERGGVTYDNPNMMTQQEGFFTGLTDVDEFDSSAQAFTSEGVPNTCGRVLDGSRAINAGFYGRADQDFFRQPGVNWDLRVVDESFEWIEKSTVFSPQIKTWQSAILDGVLEARIGPCKGYDLNHEMGTKIEGSILDRSGRRYSTADLLIHSTSPSLFMTAQCAIGVVYRDSQGAYDHVMAKQCGEAIFSAGAIGSPQLLLLSGTGSRPYLSSMVIPVVHHHLPDVGWFLHDTPRNGISKVRPVPFKHSIIQVVGITKYGSHTGGASCVVPLNSPVQAVFIGSLSSPLHLTVATTLMEKLIGPPSCGSLRTNPVVRFKYFSNPIDAERCVSGMWKIGNTLKSREDIEIADWYGGCVLGKVVDRVLRIMGIDALRVVDGSTYSISPGTDPRATVMILSFRNI